MISDLSPGDKLSLKGRIFELQKKLSLLDLETRQAEKQTLDHPYTPTMYTAKSQYKRVADSHAPVNMNVAEVIRQQKRDQVRDSVIAANNEGCTFSPESYTRNSRALAKVSKDTRPAHERLLERGKQSQEKRLQQDIQHSQFDTYGNRLFEPRISTTSWRHLNLPADTVGVDEFLYQDAKDREVSVFVLVLLVLVLVLVWVW
jgi:hypothetical protein